jgi:hypothetical protein
VSLLLVGVLGAAVFAQAAAADTPTTGPAPDPNPPAGAAPDPYTPPTKPRLTVKRRVTTAHVRPAARIPAAVPVQPRRRSSEISTRSAVTRRASHRIRRQRHRVAAQRSHPVVARVTPATSVVAAVARGAGADLVVGRTADGAPRRRAAGLALAFLAALSFILVVVARRVGEVRRWL